jgi:hypothetical protein
MSRRVFIGNSAAMLLALAGCSQTAPVGSTPVVVDLTTAQTWASEVVDGITAEVTAVNASLNATLQKTVSQILGGIAAANTAFQSIASGTTTLTGFANQIIGGIVQLVGQLAPFVPALALTDPLGMGIQLALTVLTAFTNALPIVVPPVPAALHRAALAYRGHRR